METQKGLLRPHRQPLSTHSPHGQNTWRLPLPSPLRARAPRWALHLLVISVNSHFLQEETEAGAQGGASPATEQEAAAAAHQAPLRPGVSAGRAEHSASTSQGPHPLRSPPANPAFEGANSTHVLRTDRHSKMRRSPLTTDADLRVQDQQNTEYRICGFDFLKVGSLCSHPVSSLSKAPTVCQVLWGSWCSLQQLIHSPTHSFIHSFFAL